MKYLYVGLTYHPVNTLSLNLHKIATRIREQKGFSFNHIEKFYLHFSSFDKHANLIIYYNGTVYYRKKTTKNIFNLKEIKNLAKEGYNAIQKIFPEVPYSQQLGIVLQGDNAKTIYTNNRPLIKDFSKDLFHTSCIQELEIQSRRIQISISTQERPLLTL